MSSKRRAVFILVALLGVVMLAAAVLVPRARNAAANPLGGIESIGLGETYSCAVTTVGSVKCWGGYDGPIPVDVAGLSSVGAVATAGAGNQSCALTTAGAVKCWYAANTTPTEVTGLSSGVTSIGVGALSACAVKSGGLWCWGAVPGTGETSAVPTTVGGLSSGVAAVATGTGHICVLMTSGGVKCFGDNFVGQLGDGTTTYRASPTDVVGLTSGVLAVGAGYNFSCALTSSGVKCWGGSFGTTLLMYQV